MFKGVQGCSRVFEGVQGCSSWGFQIFEAGARGGGAEVGELNVTSPTSGAHPFVHFLGFY